MSRHILGTCIMLIKRNFQENMCVFFSHFISVPCDHMNISKFSFLVNLLGFSVQRYEQIAYYIFINLKGNFWL